MLKRIAPRGLSICQRKVRLLSLECLFPRVQRRHSGEPADSTLRQLMYPSIGPLLQGVVIDFLKQVVPSVTIQHDSLPRVM